MLDTVMFQAYKNSMNQRGNILPLITIIVAVVVLAGAGWYFLRPQEATAPGLDQNEKEYGDDIKEDGENIKYSGKLNDLFSLGGNVMCTFGAATEGSNGTVYVANNGNQMRSDFSTKAADGSTLNSHMMRDGQFAYVWSDDQAQGTKIAISDTELTVSPNPQSPTKNSEILDANYAYDCATWIVDNSKFTLPTDKDFIDLSQQLQQLQNQAQQQIPAVNCSACDSLQGSTKTQCLQSLGC